LKSEQPVPKTKSDRIHEDHQTRALENLDNAPILAPTPRGKTSSCICGGPIYSPEEFDQRSGAVLIC